jgi:SAM-dependent methyltransferase
MNKYQVTVNTFNKLADKYQDKYMHMDFYHDTYDKFCQYLTKPNAEIFEIACGPGNITQYILKKRSDYKVFGIDLAPNMVELARNNNPTADFEVMDSRNIEQVEREFDAILCGFCLPYLSKDDAAKLIKDSAKLLRTDGLIYISTMEDDYDKSGYQTSSSGDKAYIFYHQANYLIEKLEVTGFEIVDVQRKEFPAELGAAATDLFIIAKLK